jgi:hypothetical protein
MESIKETSTKVATVGHVALIPKMQIITRKRARRRRTVIRTMQQEMIAKEAELTISLPGSSCEGGRSTIFVRI